MLIGAYGRFWERSHVDFDVHGWRLLGRQGINTGTIKVVDFRYARGIYVLYNEIGVYYVGLASGESSIGRRLKDHLRDEHGSGWSRFSWFAFDSPSLKGGADGVHGVEFYQSVQVTDSQVIRDLEALLQVAMQPFANKSQTKFADASEWIQVATLNPELRTFDSIRHRLR